MHYIDSVLSIGKEHKICEDYVLVNDEIIPFIVVSDGCSSSNNTDIGSRFIAINTKNYILEHYENTIKNKHNLITVFKQAFKHIKLMCLSEVTLDATLLMAFIYQDKIHYFSIGDGIITYKNTEKTVIENLSFKNENVFYGNYFNNVHRLYQFNKLNIPLNIEITEIVGSKTIVTIKEERDFIYYNFVDLKNLEYLFISTDGLLSCSGDKELSKHFLLEFIQFKNLKGEFIQRRYNMWKKNILKLGVNHQDDIGIAGFSFFKDIL